MKTLSLAKRWFSREDAEEYGEVNDLSSTDDEWIVTFPDDDIPMPGVGTPGEGS